MRASDGVVVANVGVHLAEVALAATVMAPGAREAPLADRMAWIALHPPGWTIGWAVWGASAVIDVLVISAFARQLDDRRAARLAVALTAAGATIDLGMDVLHVLVNPVLAARGDPSAFLRAEGIAWTVGAACANPLYCAGTVGVTAALWREQRIGRAPVALALGTAAFGASLVLAALFGGPMAIQATAGPTIALFTMWSVGVAWALRAETAPRAPIGGRE